MQYTLAHSVPQEAKCCYRQTTRRLSVRNLPGSLSPRLNRPTARVSFPLRQGNRTMRASLPEVEITHRVSPEVWNVLVFQIGHGRHIREALRWLSRSGTIQLHVFIFDGFLKNDFRVDGPVGADNADLMALTQSLWRVLPRIRSLSLRNPTPKLYQFFWPGSDSAITPAPPLSPTPLQDLSSLSLYLRKGFHTERQLIQSLTQVPKLKNLWVDGSFERDNDDPTL